MTWPQRLERGIAGGLVLALAVVFWPRAEAPRPKPAPAVAIGGSIQTTPKAHAHSGHVTLEGATADDGEVELACSYVGTGNRGYITVGANGDLTFESVYEAAKQGSMGRAVERINSTGSDWRCIPRQGVR